MPGECQQVRCYLHPRSCNLGAGVVSLGREIFLFPKPSRLGVLPPIQWIPGSGREANRSFHYSAEVKNEKSYTSTSLCASMVCRGTCLYCVQLVIDILL